MAEPVTTFELNCFFNEKGEIVMGGGLHVKLCGPGTPTVATIQSLVDRVHEWGVEQLGPEYTEGDSAFGRKLKATETPQDKAETRDDSALHCPRKGVWASARGQYPEGFRETWRHNSPKVNKSGVLYCPTPIGKDKATDKLLWCTWRAKEGPNGSYEEFDVTTQEKRAQAVKDELPFEETLYYA